ncbi:hypothetical protein WOC76_12480 [Methylocystis sp. IM3]|uniref:hypothetical protein n=1 Tax=unclassified Methylocystis TaxID=2625913 RepID=UPI0030FB2BBA
MFPVKTSIALRVAGLDRIKFNLIVHSGFYECAPETTEGSARLFEENDVVALVVFGDLLGVGILPRFAGPMACELRELLEAAPGFGGKYAFPLENDGKGAIVSEGDDPTAPPRISITIDVKAVREHVAREIAEHF